jgi:hypothetical protein
LSNAPQLNLFDRSNPDPLPAPSIDPASESDLTHGFVVGDRIQIVNAGSPLEHLNGRRGEIVGLRSDVISVRVESIAVTLAFRPEALEKWTTIREYSTAGEEAETVEIVRVGDRVECSCAFIGRIGTVRKLGMHLAVRIAWVDYGAYRPWYPVALENLNLA